MREQDPKIHWGDQVGQEDLIISVTPGDVTMVMAVGRPAFDEPSQRHYFSVTASTRLPDEREALRASALSLHSSLLRVTAEAMGITPHALLDAVSDYMFAGQRTNVGS